MDSNREHFFKKLHTSKNLLLQITEQTWSLQTTAQG